MKFNLPQKHYRLESELSQKTYKNAVDSYEQILELRDSRIKTRKLDELFADALDLLSKRNYTSASAKIRDMGGKIEEEKAKLAAASAPPIPATVYSCENNDISRR